MEIRQKVEGKGKTRMATSFYCLFGKIVVRTFESVFSFSNSIEVFPNRGHIHVNSLSTVSSFSFSLFFLFKNVRDLTTFPLS